MDTGATKTQMSWNDASDCNLTIRSLQPDNWIYTGITGSVKGYNLPKAKLIFSTDVGMRGLFVDNLSVMDYETTDGKQCPISSSMLGMDVLCMFDILVQGDYAFLRLQTIRRS